MKHLSLILTVSVLAATAARAEPFEIACARGDEERKIEVLEPGTVGQACDVRYTRNAGASVSVPYHADNDTDFCAEKARELVDILAGSGFACAPADRPSLAAAPAPQDSAVESAAAPAPQDSAVESAAAVAPTEVGAPPPVAAAVTPQPAPVASPPAPADEPSPQALAQKLDEVLQETPPAPAENAAPAPANVAEPAPQDSAVEPARQGPVALTESQAEPAPPPRAEPVGKIVGAEPSPSPSLKTAPKPKPQAPAAAPPPAQSAAEPAPAVAPAPAAEPAAQPTPAAKPAAERAPSAAPAPASEASRPRPVQEVIRATLAAQAAAWNEGDLEGFMNGYWKSDDLRFVSGAEVFKGWSQTMKRYRSRYGEGRALGQLRFTDLEIELVRHDVAVVVGRFDLQRGDSADSGLFTLVMKRIDGAWRIVHDHTVANPKAAE